MTKWPRASVVAVRKSPLAWFLRVTLALGTTAPMVSNAVPLRVPVSCCAVAAAEKKSTMTATSVIVQREHRWNSPEYLIKPPKNVFPLCLTMRRPGARLWRFSKGGERTIEVKSHLLLHFPFVLSDGAPSKSPGVICQTYCVLSLTRSGISFLLPPNQDCQRENKSDFQLVEFRFDRSGW